jgi:uncharacterized protein with von Willebrand factor type A (vWA) domain
MSDEQDHEGQPQSGQSSGTGAAEQGAGAAGGAADPEQEVAKWKALSRKHEAQAKANADAAKRLAEMEEAGKTEAQKFADKAAASEQAAAHAQQEVARLRVAMRKGLTEAQAKRLVGTTEEELEADADELLATFGASRAPGSDTGAGRPARPKERLRSGASVGDADPDPVRAVNDSIRRAAGRRP